MATVEAKWNETNQRDLLAALAGIRAALERHAAKNKAAPQVQTAVEGMDAPVPPALEMLCSTFGLSAFEHDLLLLCAAMELDSTFADLCAAAQGDPSRGYPTFSLALAALPKPHWSALSPAAPLRHWRLIEVVQQPGALLTTSQLRIDERVLHFLTGVHYLDDRLHGLFEHVHPGPELVPSHAAVAREIKDAWRGGEEALPIVHLCGGDEASRRTIAASGCAECGLHLYALAADLIPSNPAELEGLLRLWEREAALAATALCVEADSVDSGDSRAVAHTARFLERANGPVLLSTRERWRPLRRRVRAMEVRKPTPQEQGDAWRALLSGVPAAHTNGSVTELVSQFNLDIPAIRASVEQALAPGADGDTLAMRLWDAGRTQARPRLEDLTQRIEPAACWTDMVLPERERSMLQQIAAHVRHRATVYDVWGFGRLGARGLGIGALFSGASGTGKTMAAEVLANELRLDLYRIDLSSVVSKYIGETEKNLRRVFDAAEDGGAILFFDEADALFGKRSEVKDAHDRYANIEINYLLQRMESYRGLAVLATNRKADVDPAFLRRIRFIVNFPFPDLAQRAEIWRRVFPPRTPLEGLDIGLLSRLNIAGGNIRNIALNAAFLAAEAGQPVRMPHLAHAARNEFAKMDKPLEEAEIGGWR
jgi:hypothetical protein